MMGQQVCIGNGDQNKVTLSFPVKFLFQVEKKMGQHLEWHFTKSEMKFQTSPTRLKRKIFTVGYSLREKSKQGDV